MSYSVEQTAPFFQPARAVRRTGLLGLLIAALALPACNARDEVFLPGPREGLREVLQDAEDDTVVENTSAPIALGTTTRNAEWAQFWGTPSERTAHPALPSAPSLAWSASIGAGDNRKGRITADPVVGGGRIYTLDAHAQVTATSVSGAPVWSRDLTPAGDQPDQATGGGIAYEDGRIYVTSGFGFVTALDAANGQTIWTQDLQSTGSGAPTVCGDLVYLSAGDNTGWAIEKSNGRIAWQIGTVEDVGNVIGAPAPAVTSDLAIFAFGSGDVQAVFRRGGLRRWDTTVIGERRGYALAEIGDITAAPVVDGKRVYVGNQSGRTVALDAGNGSRLWTAKEGAIDAIWPAGGSVFMVSDRNELVRLSAEDGSRIWGVKLPNFTNDRPRRRSEVFAHYGPVVAGGRVILVSNDGLMRSFDPTNGALINSVEIPGGASTRPAIAGGVLYVVSTRGDLLAFR